MDVFNENLKKSYDNVGNQIFEDLDFIDENLKSSLNLFEASSIAKKVPIPKIRGNSFAIWVAFFNAGFELFLWYPK